MSAARLGASKVLAVDYDPVAVKVATENIRQNGLQEQITVKQNDLLTGLDEKVDLIIANIIADIIMRAFPQVKERLSPQGVFLASGIIGERRDEVTQTGYSLGFELIEETVKKIGWLRHGR